MNQTLGATSSNHTEIIIIYEVSRNCVWLGLMTHHIQEICVFSLERDISVTMYENNVASITRSKGRYNQRKPEKTYFTGKKSSTHDPVVR